MANHGRIPRPRHLFPETAAAVIQARRGLFLGTRSIRRVVGRISPWTAGAACGLCGMMFAVLLFFLADPVIQAAPSAAVVSQPEKPTIEPTETLPPPVEAHPNRSSQVNLVTQILRTRLPLSWDQKQIATRVSRPTAPPPVSLTPSFSDPWRQAFQRPAPSVPGPYAGLGLNVLSGYGTVASSNQPPGLERILSKRGLGVILEKFAPAKAVTDVPFQYEIRVTNPTHEEIESLLLTETVSEHHRVVNAQPESHVEAGRLIWNITHLGAGEVRRFLVTVLPLQHVELATHTRLTSVTRVAAGNVVTEPAPSPPDPEPLFPITTPPPAAPPVPSVPPRVEVQPPPADPGFPLLKLTVSPPERLKKGENLSVVFTVENVGTADATNVTLFVRLSGEFQHRYGEFVKHPIAVLRPGQRHRALLQAIARDEGDAKIDANLTMGETVADNRLWTIPIRRPLEHLSERPVSPKNDRRPYHILNGSLQQESSAIRDWRQVSIDWNCEPF